MGVKAEADELLRRAERVIGLAGTLSLKAAHRTFRDEAALVEIDALDAKLRLAVRPTQYDAATLFVVDRELTRLERRFDALGAWLDAHGLDAQFVA